MEYNKQPLSHSQLIALLKERGLRFRNEDAALEEFKMLSYFRISGYLRPMEKDVASHSFGPNSYFEDALDAYYFDKELRSLIFTAIQSIEIAFRSRMIDRVSMKYGAFWYAKPSLAEDQSMYEDNLCSIKKEVKRTREDFIRSHNEKYGNTEYYPVWKTLEVTSFGTLSKLYSNLNDIPLKKEIASDFHLPQHICMESWIKSIVVLRNHIAHHARIWNRRFSLSPQLPKYLPKPWADVSKVKRFKLYALLCCLQYLENTIHPNSTFREKLLTLITSHSNMNLHLMGFPDDWKDEPMWH